MEMTASRSILQMAAKFRKNYLANFYELNRTATQSNSNANQPLAYVIFAGQGREEMVSRFIEILLAQGIEVYQNEPRIENFDSLYAGDSHGSSAGTVL